jgi:hypothetical protein
MSGEFLMSMEDFDVIDDRVKELVCVLNKFKGIETFSSCGGHANPDISQICRGRFSVDFFVEPNKTGFGSLENINQWMTRICPSSAEIVVGDVGGIGEGEIPCMCFEMRGRANPRLIALVLQDCLNAYLKGKK